MRAARAGLLTVLAGLAGSVPAAHAQVTVNPGALELLPAPKAAPARPAPRPAPRPAAPARPNGPTPHATPTPAPTENTQANAPANAAPAARPPAPPEPPVKPALPTVPPAVAALPPPAPVPPPRPQPPPVVPMADDAPGAVAILPGGVRVTFGADRQDLNPTTEAAIKTVAKTLRENDQATVNIYAYAAGTPDDISTSRRLSLARALAARAVLVNEGIASTRIYPRSLGAAGGDMGADRVDVVIGPPGPPSAGAAATPLPSPAPAPQTSGK